MTEYVPSEKERIHEKGISISDSISPFSCNLDPIFDAERNINWNIATKVYTQFRVLMRDAEEHETIHVDPDASPKRKSGQKRKRGDSAENEAAAASQSPKVSPPSEADVSPE